WATPIIESLASSHCTMSAVCIEHLSKIYTPRTGWLQRLRNGGREPRGFQALDDVSLTIQHGEFFGLLGPNGAGKTSLISVLAGLSSATSGRVSVCGYDVSEQYGQARRSL